MEQSGRYKVASQLEEDLNKFALTSNLLNFTMNKKLNIKRVIYRSITLFLSALGHSYGVQKHSSLEIIDELKRRNLLSKMAAQKLCLAVAVACHVRLVHYSSKNRQDDDIYEENEFEGKEKFQQLTKIVNPMWLINSLATAQYLQMLLSSSIHLSQFDKVLELCRNVPLNIMAILGLHKQLILYGERLLSSLPVVSPYDCLMFDVVCTSYIKLRLYDKCLKMLKILRKKLEQPYQATADTPEEHRKAEYFPEFHQDAENFMKMQEAQCLFRTKEFSCALELTEGLLKTNLIPETFVVVSLSNIQCKIAVGHNHKSLSSIRDLRKSPGTGELKQWFYGVLYVDVIRYIVYSLIGAGREKQGLHWARQGLNFVKLHGFTYFYIELYQDLIKYVATNDTSNLMKQFFLH